jgi:hypothetical protein
MKHRRNAHHSNDRINISSKRCVTSAAAGHWAAIHWRQDVGAKTCSSDRARGGDYAFAFVVMVAERIVAERMSPIRQRQLVQADTSGPVITVFSSAAYVFICSPASEAGPQGGAPDFCAFGKQLTALFAKILAFQAIILAF